MVISFGGDGEGYLAAERRRPEVDFVEVEGFAAERLDRAGCAVLAEGDRESLGEVEVVAQEQLGLLIVAVVTGNPGQFEYSLPEHFRERLSADGICIGPGQRLDLVDLQVAKLIVKGLGSSRVGSGCDVVIVLELPVGPRSEVHLHQVSQPSYLLRALYRP